MSSRNDLLRLDDQLCFALYAASRALTRAYADLLGPLGLTYPQYLVLLVLWEQDGATVKRLGERLALDSGTLTPLLKRLEQQRLLTRRRGAEDERVVHVQLTADGKALKSKARRVPHGIACRAGFDLEDPTSVTRLETVRDELRALARQLAKVEEAKLEEVKR